MTENLISTDNNLD